MLDIRRLSSADKISSPSSVGLIVVGSFAPVHEGHFDAMRSAERALQARDWEVSANVFSPNSDSYVRQKLQDSEGIWSFGRRVNGFIGSYCGTTSPSFVDDISGSTPPERSISEAAVTSTSRQLGIRACNLMLVVGSDQIASMRSHLQTNRAICILRPGYETVLEEYAQSNWFMEAVEAERYILADREDSEKDISSTEIRKLRKHQTTVQL